MVRAFRPHQFQQYLKINYERGADVDAKTTEGKTPMTFFETDGQAEVLDWLRTNDAKKS